MKYDITKFNPCESALDYYNQFDTSEDAWKNCPRGDWMLWIASQLGIDDRKLTLAKALCANTVKHLMKDKRSREAVYVAFKYGRGKATKDELRTAAANAAAASNAAASAAAAKKKNQLQTADICRKVLTESVFEKIWEEQK